MKIRNKKGIFTYAGGTERERRDKPCPDCGKLIMRKSTYCRSCSQTGKRSAMWKDKDMTYSTLHKWMTKHYGQPRYCEECETTGAKHYNWANKSYKYKRDRGDWLRLCRSCHLKRDSGKNWGKASDKFPEIRSYYGI